MISSVSDNGGQVAAAASTEAAAGAVASSETKTGKQSGSEGNGANAVKDKQTVNTMPRQKSPLADTEIQVAFIKFDDTDYPRAQVDQKAVDEYAQEMEVGAEFPAIEVFKDGDVYWLADGRHRVEACRKIGKVNIRAKLYLGNRVDAVLHSLSANAEYGVRRSNADKRKAVTILLKDPGWSQWNDSEIARTCRVSPALVSSVREEQSAAGGQPLENEDGGVKLVRRGGDSVYPMKLPRPKAAKKSQEKAAAVSLVMDSAGSEPAEESKTFGKSEEGVCRVILKLHEILISATSAAGARAFEMRALVSGDKRACKNYAGDATEFASKLLAEVDIKVDEAKVALEELRSLLSPETTTDAVKTGNSSMPAAAQS